MKTVDRKRHKASKFTGFEVYEHQKSMLVEEIVGSLYGKYKDETLAVIAQHAQVGMTTLRRLNNGSTLFPRMDTLWKMAKAAGLRFQLAKEK